MAPGKMQVAVPVFPEVKLMAFIDAKANPYLFACQCRYCSYLIVSFHIRYIEYRPYHKFGVVVCDAFTHILHGCFFGIGAIQCLPQLQWYDTKQ